MKSELNVNESKTEFIIFGAPKRNKIEEIVVNGCTVLEKRVVKYLGVQIVCNLSFDEEIKNVLRKMAVGINVIYSIKKIFHEKTRSALLNALVLSHLHYPIVLFSGLKKSLRVTLNKQLNGGIKACFNRTKFDRTTDLKIKHKILPVEYLIKYRVIIYFIKLLKADLPAFDELKLATLSAKMNDRTNKLSFGANQKTNIMQNCFSKKAIDWYNDLPLALRRNIPKKRALKTTIKNHFWNEFLKDPTASEWNSNLKSFKFNLNLISF